MAHERDTKKYRSTIQYKECLQNAFDNTVGHERSVDNLRDVLLVPDGTTVIRSVSVIVGAHKCTIIFTAEGAYITDDLMIPGQSFRIATRRDDGLYHIVSDTIPSHLPKPQVTTFLAIAQQINQEQAHRLHRTPVQAPTNSGGAPTSTTDEEATHAEEDCSSGHEADDSSTEESEAEEHLPNNATVSSATVEDCASAQNPLGSIGGGGTGVPTSGVRDSDKPQDTQRVLARPGGGGNARLDWVHPTR